MDTIFPPNLRVICFIPSLTETLIECDVHVIGRTRFCIHPEEKVKGIPIVGGTKDADWDKIADLQPDLVIFDREENTLEMAEACNYPFFDSHITSLETLASELARLGKKLSNKKLFELSQRTLALLKRPRKKVPLPTLKVIKSVAHETDQFLYLIWRNPWMAVSRKTFIGSVCEFLGNPLPEFETRYPQIDLNKYDPNMTTLLFSSEPYPFHKHEDKIRELPFPSALVNGESYSWFGIRAIRFLEEVSS